MKGLRQPRGNGTPQARLLGAKLCFSSPAWELGEAGVLCGSSGRRSRYCLQVDPQSGAADSGFPSSARTCPFSLPPSSLPAWHLLSLARPHPGHLTHPPGHLTPPLAVIRAAPVGVCFAPSPSSSSLLMPGCPSAAPGAALRPTALLCFCPQELLHYLIGTLLLLIASIVAASKSYSQSKLVAASVRTSSGASCAPVLLEGAAEGLLAGASLAQDQRPPRSSQPGLAEPGGSQAENHRGCGYTPRPSGPASLLQPPLKSVARRFEMACPWGAIYSGLPRPLQGNCLEPRALRSAGDGDPPSQRYQASRFAACRPGRNPALPFRGETDPSESPKRGTWPGTKPQRVGSSETPHTNPHPSTRAPTGVPLL